jgi:hypothetical protein
MAKRKPRKIKKEPGSARPTAAERRKQRSEADALRQQINPPQLVSEIKANQRAIKKIWRDEIKHPENDNDAKLRAISEHNKTNLALLRFVLPTLKTVELAMDGDTVESFCLLLNADP